ncbi:hypothetical protein AOXY_G20586 [Acipenser oxyrinchus oxyrinchus]|uniref:Uncharacterized protein n=1 Tax=Acipenser oxyrinchus oxyrinchus TaxID=40147 RepID=A0AAD8D0P2_ACIOX|nr:hypothetical protein AOXY_G20586 [Acipenser oxyrinchus oxyrinchus]
MENIKAEDDQLPCTGTCAEDESTLDIQEGFKVEVSPIEEVGSELQYPCIKQEEPAVKEEVLEVQVAEIKEEVSPLDHGELSQDGRQTSSTSTTNPIQQRRGDEYPTHLCHTDSPKREEQREDEATSQQDNCVRPAQSSPAQSPSVRQSPKRELVTAPRSRRRRRIMEENSDALQPFLRLQQSGFNMLQRELRMLGRNLNSRVGRLEHRVGGMEQSLFRINNNLSRLADAAERYLSRAPTSDAAV